jgi:predicted metal-binding protein
MPARIPEEVRIKQINSIPNIEFIGWFDCYKNKESKAIVRCSVDGYEWPVSIYSLINKGSGCPQCSGKRIWNELERIEQINKMEKIRFVSWLDVYKNSFSKANVRCLKDGFEWSAQVNCLINHARGCPQCSNLRRWTEEDRIKQINDIDNIEFVSWASEYKNHRSKANVRCTIDNFEWSAEVSSLINGGRGCPSCSRKRRWTAAERIEHINELENIEFISWLDGYKDACSKANVKCEIDGFEWAASVSNLVNNGSGCPKCSKHGFNQAKTGYLYALRSECGMYVKVGISNKPKVRHSQLERRTPFKFNLVERFSGGGSKIAELERYFHSKYEGAGFAGFDGATEWLACSDELLGELRSINA